MMDFITIKENLFPFLATSIIILLFGTGLYFIRKKLHKHVPPFSTYLLYLLLFCWMITVLGLTMFGRNTYLTNNINLKLLSGYFNAWNTWNIHELQMIVFNLLMFMPLGFLLSFLLQSKHKTTKVLWISFFISLMIEFLQLITKRGIFELDDLIHNTIGSMMGYFLAEGITSWIKHKRVSLPEIGKALAIPTFFLIIFLSCMTVYHFQEFGNLAILSAERPNMTGVSIKQEITLNDKHMSVSIFHNQHTFDMENAKKTASLLSEQFGLTLDNTIRKSGHDRFFYFTKENEQYFLLYHLRNGTWDFNNRVQEAITLDQENEQAAEIEQWLRKMNLLSGEATYELQDDKTLTWTKETPQDLTTRTDPFTKGKISITLAKDRKPNHIWNTMVDYEYVKKKQIISSNEAFQKVQSGKFTLIENLKSGDILYIKDCTLDYIQDTKGYLQPLYLFRGYVNQEENEVEIYIPALA